jgi:hypothetical protein
LTFVGGGTINWLGKTWTSGVSQYVCPSNFYVCQNSVATIACNGTYGSNKETWYNSTGADGLLVGAIEREVFFPQRILGQRNIFVRGGSLGKGTGGSWYLNVFGRLQANCPGLTTNTTAYAGTNRLSTFSPAPAALVPTSINNAAPINNVQFGQLTTNGGVTITWERVLPSAWNTCGL